MRSTGEALYDQRLFNQVCAHSVVMRSRSTLTMSSRPSEGCSEILQGMQATRTLQGLTGPHVKIT